MKTRYFAILMAAAGFWRFGIRQIRADSRRRVFLYGTEYVREQIDRALELEDPHSLVPEKR